MCANDSIRRCPDDQAWEQARSVVFSLVKALFCGFKKNHDQMCAVFALVNFTCTVSGWFYKRCSVPSQYRKCSTAAGNKNLQLQFSRLKAKRFQLLGSRSKPRFLKGSLKEKPIAPKQAPHEHRRKNIR